LLTALVQVVMGMRRLKKLTAGWRLMERHEVLNGRKGSGKPVIATARKMAVIIRHMLSEGTAFNAGFMADRKWKDKAVEMSRTALLAGQGEREGTGNREAG
jgi:hypothetical protein